MLGFFSHGRGGSQLETGSGERHWLWHRNPGNLKLHHHGPHNFYCTGLCLRVLTIIQESDEDCFYSCNTVHRPSQFHRDLNLTGYVCYQQMVNASRQIPSDYQTSGSDFEHLIIRLYALNTTLSHCKSINSLSSWSCRLDKRWKMCQMSEIVSREGEAGPIGSRVRKSGSIGQNLVTICACSEFIFTPGLKSFSALYF